MLAKERGGINVLILCIFAKIMHIGLYIFLNKNIQGTPENMKYLYF